MLVFLILYHKATTTDTIHVKYMHLVVPSRHTVPGSGINGTIGVPMLWTTEMDQNFKHAKLPKPGNIFFLKNLCGIFRIMLSDMNHQLSNTIVL